MLPSELLYEHTRWVQGAQARLRNYTACRYDDPNACRWCLGAAIAKCGSPPDLRPALTQRVYEYAAQHGYEGMRSIELFNDHVCTTYEIALQLLRLAEQDCGLVPLLGHSA